MIRWGMPGEQIRQACEHIVTPELARRRQGQALLGKLVDHRQDAERSTIMGFALYEVITSDMTWAARHEHFVEGPPPV